MITTMEYVSVRRQHARLWDITQIILIWASFI